MGYMVVGVVLFNLKTLALVSFDLGSLLTWEVKHELSQGVCVEGEPWVGPQALPGRSAQSAL